MNPRLLLAGLITLSCAGCVAPLERFEATLEEAGIARFSDSGGDAADHAVVVQSSRSNQGHGAAIRHDQVLTVSHVVGTADEVLVRKTTSKSWARARVIQRIRAHPEDLVLLQVEVDDGVYGALLGFTGFDHTLRPSFGGRPTSVACSRGSLPWRGRALRPGDSGSPVLDALGDLVGLVVGRRGDQPVYARLPTTPVLAHR